MHLVIRILLAAAVILAMAVAVYFAEPSLGIERGGWQHAILIGIIIAITGQVWRATAPKK